MNPTTQEKMKNKVSTIYEYLEELKSFSSHNLDHSRFLAERILGTVNPDESKKPTAEPISGILNSIIESLADIKEILILTKTELLEVKKEIE